MPASSEDVEFRIRKFNPRNMEPDTVNLFIGKRNSGKSFLMKDILYHARRRYPAGNVISGTDHVNHFYDKFIPGMLIHREYDAIVLEKLFKRQEKAKAEGWQTPGAFLVMDDCLSDRKWQYDPLVRRLFLEGRHYHLLCLLGLQNPMSLFSDMRGQADYVFILRNSILEERKKIHKNYCGFVDYDTFEALMDTCTEDYGCLVVDKVTRSNKKEDQIFYYKAEPHDDIRLCHEQFWKENAANYSSSAASSSSPSQKHSSTNGAHRRHSHSSSTGSPRNKEEYSTSKKGRRITISKRS